MIKTVIKFLLVVVVYTLVYMICNAVFPFSRSFRELEAPNDSMAMLYLLLDSVWVCFVIYFIVRNSGWKGIKLSGSVVFVIFFVQFFMTQIETLLFGSAFKAITGFDILLIMLAGLPPLLAASPLAVKFFGNRDIAPGTITLNLKSTAVKLFIIGIIYLFIYMFFGYFVAWQFTDLRIFYSGSAEKSGFFGQMLNNLADKPFIFPFQIIRGILFSLFILPLRKMILNNRSFIISVCLVYLCPAIMLIIPNPLFPDIVRIGHLIEMTSSMLLFGIITGYILKNAKPVTA